jgi:HEPN domain-containing protein
MPEQVISWLTLADDDYVASRTLLRSGLLLQGAILANSAIEKYLKTAHRILNISFQTRGEKAHELSTLYKQLHEKSPETELNESYLTFLTRAYKMRYPDRLEEEYNLAISQAKTLVGLDETVFKIRNRIQLKGERPFSFDMLLEKRHEPLTQGNHAFCAEFKREELFKNPVLCYEVRVLKNGVWMEATYTAHVEDDNKYDLEAWRHGSTDREFNLQWTPIQQEKVD